MKQLLKLLVLCSVLLSTFLLASPAYSDWKCYSTNARGNGTWVGVAHSMGKAQWYANNYCMQAFRTGNPNTCHITNCVPVGGYVPPPPPPPVVPVAPVAPSKFVCTAYGQYGHRMGVGSSHNLAKAMGRAVSNCQMNGGVNCSVVNSASCPAY
jgi:hypothetical protein